MIRLASTALAILLGLSCGPHYMRPWRESRYYTPDSRYRLDVVKQFTGSADDPELKARAEIRARGFFGHRLERRFELVNPLTTRATITSDGSLVVALGPGDTDAIVFYRGDGTVLRRFHMEDLLTADDIMVFGYSRSSHSARELSWATPGLIDERTMQLVLQFARPRGLPNGLADAPEQLRLDLRTMAPVEPKRDRWPYPFWTRAAFVDDEPAATKIGRWTSATGECGRTADDAPLMTSTLLEQRVRDRQLPTYPEIAERARIRGIAVIEILVAANGTVECTRVLQPQPFLDAAATTAARTWTFAPFDGLSPAPFVRGRIAFDFYEEWR